MANNHGWLFSLRIITRVLARPAYALTAVGLSLAFFLILRYLFSIQVVAAIWASPAVSTIEKLSFILLGFKPDNLAELGAMLTDPVAISLAVASVLQGIAVTMIIFLRRRQTASSSRHLAGGLGASLLGSGCVACGGSIIYPLLASLGSPTAAVLSRSLGLTASLLAIGLILYALSRLSQQIALWLTVSDGAK